MTSHTTTLKRSIEALTEKWCLVLNYTINYFYAHLRFIILIWVFTWEGLLLYITLMFRRRSTLLMLSSAVVALFSLCLKHLVLAPVSLRPPLPIKPSRSDWPVGQLCCDVGLSILQTNHHFWIELKEQTWTMSLFSSLQFFQKKFLLFNISQLQLLRTTRNPLPRWKATWTPRA